MDDAELLAQYASNRSEAAFAELLRRYVDLVYSSALRQLGGKHHLAQDVTQTVFIDLARKAAALARHPSLVAWLFRCTRYSVFNVRRLEARRRALGEALARDPTALPDLAPTWEAIAPVLDDAVDELSEKDRTAVLLRFFAQKPFAEVGKQLGVSENAARMRVDRAVETLREVLARRGIASTAAALASLTAANGVLAAPASVVPGVAIAVLTAPGTTSILLTALSTMSKIKIGIMAAIVATGAIGLWVEGQSRSGLRAETARLRAVGEDLARVQVQGGDLQRDLQTLGAKNPEMDELNRVRSRIALLKSRPEGVTESQMKPLAVAGRATPDAAYATFLAGINAGDLNAVASIVSFRDGPATEAQKQAFMAKFNDAIRARYRTPEQLFAAAYVGMQDGVASPSPGASYQVLGTQEIFPGVVQVRFWVAGPDGEREVKDSFQKTADGWSIVFRPLIDRAAAEVRGLLDPVTGLPKATQK